jgi:hypothetical protein
MANNKLKVKLDTPENKDAITGKIHQKTKDKYRRHKLLSQEFCEWFLQKEKEKNLASLGLNLPKDNEGKNWLEHYQNHKKKDDLADTYLMCVYGQQNSNNF